MKQFKIRASACGQIMTNPRSKSEIISQTTKSYIDIWLKEQIYNRQREISTKYMQKGLIVEDNSLDFIAEQLGYGLLIKNEKHFENSHITGTPDIVLKDLIIDVKNSWDCFTFPLFSETYPKDYYYQAQCYMNLTGVYKFKLIYVLSDTPENLIVSEMRRYAFQHGIEPDNDLIDTFKDKMTYSDIPNKYKIKVFDITYNEECIKDIINRIEECRNYIKSII